MLNLCYIFKMRNKAKKPEPVTEKSTEIKSNLKDNNQFPIEFCFNINRESYTVAGYLVDDIQLRRHPDKDVILDSAIEYLESPSTLADLIKTDPKCMYEDGGVIMALYILNDIASGPKSEESKRAAIILREVRRRDLLPKAPDGKPETNKTSNELLYFWQHEPEDLLDFADKYKRELRKLIESCPERHGRRIKFLWTLRGGVKVYECCVNHAFRTKTNREPTRADLYPIKHQENIGTLTLLFISAEFGIDYDALRKRYYKISDEGKLKQPHKTATEIILQKESELEIEPLDSKNNPTLLKVKK